MLDALATYLPAGVLAAGTVATLLVGTPRPTPLREPLAQAIPSSFLGAPASELAIGADEVSKSGVSDYINRVYMLSATEGLSVYVGYHATQQGDKQMHSPSLCLPGSGWTPVDQQIVSIPVAGESVRVNRFILQMGSNRMLTYYWFQGRGRVTAGQGELKLNAMWDAVTSHRDDEALVRIIVPITRSDTGKVASTGLTPDALAARMAEHIIPTLARSLPAAPGGGVQR